MRQKLAIFLVFAGLILILIGLNAASYVQKEKIPDKEAAPNRSTFNAGATGTLGFYTLLSETGRKIIRWQEPVDGLINGKKNAPETFVVIGTVRREFSDAEISRLLNWVSDGGRLILIDREPPSGFLKSSNAWDISIKQQNDQALYSVDPADQKEMTDRTPASKPAQPTLYTKSVNAVQASRFAASVSFKKHSEYVRSENNRTTSGSGEPDQTDDQPYDFLKDPPPPKAKPINAPKSSVTDPKLKNSGKVEPNKTFFNAPVAHISNGEQNLLVEVPYGDGEIVFLADPFIISNIGISLVDNAQLAINVIARNDGLIAFDEYHQGYGSNNQFVQFFEGTPVFAIFLQCAGLAALIFFSQSRRFARALIDKEPDRLSKLEYVAAIAELQRRTRSYDLAIESIYHDFRRRTAKLLGIDNTTVARKDLAYVIAERIKADPNDIDGLMFKCEDIIRGEPTDQKETLGLTTRLREIEEMLGLKRSRTAKI